MTDGLLDIGSTGITRRINLAWGYHHSDPADGEPADPVRTAIGWLPMLVVVAVAGWVLVSLAWMTATRPIHLASAIVQAKSGSSGSTVGLAKGGEFAFDPMTSEAIAPEQPAPVDRMKISSQSWRRGGLGSNALVTMTLRNDNGYAVKDIDVACAFLRPDGSYLTGRSRLINDVVNMKSRKTFARLHIGFVNVNAAKAKCSLVAASHV